MACAWHVHDMCMTSAWHGDTGFLRRVACVRVRVRVRTRAELGVMGIGLSWLLACRGLPATRHALLVEALCEQVVAPTREAHPVGGGLAPCVVARLRRRKVHALQVRAPRLHPPPLLRMRDREQPVVVCMARRVGERRRGVGEHGIALRRSKARKGVQAKGQGV